MDYVITKQLMISGIGEAGTRKFHKYVGKSGRTWLVADQPNAADNVYVTNNASNTTSHSQGFEGFGGRTLRMELIDGSVFELHGGWHTNSGALFEDTGIDVRATHLTFVVIAKERTYAPGSYTPVLKDVLYIDDKPTLGLFSRGETLAQQYADKLGMKVAYYSQSSGGSVASWKEPKKVAVENSAQ